MTQFTRRSTHIDGRGGMLFLQRSVGVASWFISKGRGKKGKKKKRRTKVCFTIGGNRAANYSSFCCLIRARVSREWREKEEKMEGWIRIRGEGFFLFFILIYEITNRGSKNIASICRFTFA